MGQGDRVAFSQLYDAFVARLFATIRHIIISPTLAEEVLQDVFLEIWQNAPRYDRARGTATAWMFTIARRRAIDRVRATQARHDRDVRVGIRDLVTDYDDVVETVETHTEHARALGALRRITALQRECIVLSFVDGLSNTEIATRLEVPTGTVKTRIRDGLLRLRVELTPR